MSLEKSILQISSLKKCAIASIFAGSATLSCRGFLILLILLSWRYITVVRRLLLQLLRRRVRFALRDLSPIFLLLPLLPSADLFQLYLTSPVRVASFFGVFTALFLRVSYSIGSLGVFGFLLFFADLWFHPELNVSGIHLFLGFRSHSEKFCDGPNSALLGGASVFGRTDGGC